MEPARKTDRRPGVYVTSSGALQMIAGGLESERSVGVKAELDAIARWRQR